MTTTPQTPSASTREKLTSAGWTPEDSSEINWRDPATGHPHSWPVALHLMQAKAPATPGDPLTRGPGQNWRKGHRKDATQLVPRMSRKKLRRNNQAEP